MKESNVRHTIKNKLGKIADVCAIENSAGTGMPDVNISFNSLDYWIELKYREESPKRDTTAALKGFVRPQQKIWIKHRLSKGAGNIYLFARIDNEYFCYHIYDEERLSYLETMTTVELYNESCWYGTAIGLKDCDWFDLLRIMEQKSYGHILNKK